MNELKRPSHVDRMPMDTCRVIYMNEHAYQYSGFEIIIICEYFKFFLIRNLLTFIPEFRILYSRRNEGNLVSAFLYL